MWDVCWSGGQRYDHISSLILHHGVGVSAGMYIYVTISPAYRGKRD